MNKKKGFTLMELIAVLVILAILALIVTPIVLNIVSKAKASANKRSVDAYGRSIELAVSTYLLDKGDFPTSIDDLIIEYTGSEIICEERQLNKDSSVYLSKCTVDGEVVKDSKSDDGYYHYGKRDLTGKDYINQYGKALEKVTKKYVYVHTHKPANIDDLKIDYDGQTVNCEEKKVNSDGSVYLSKCTVDGEQILDESTDDGYYHYGAIVYRLGEQITYNGMNFYVIADSDENSDSVTMLKAEPLTVSEVNTYGAGHVNRYTNSSVGTAYNNNGYGGMAYYSSETCGYPNGSSGSRVTTGCTTDYAQSEVKYVVDTWAADKFQSSDLSVDETGYSARLITFEELTINLGYEKTNGGTLYPSSSGDTPDWLYNVKYNYSTMTPYNDSTEAVGRFNTSGYFDCRSVYDTEVGVVRPVVTLLKSAL